MSHIGYSSGFFPSLRITYFIDYIQYRLIFKFREAVFSLFRTHGVREIKFTPMYCYVRFQNEKVALNAMQSVNVAGIRVAEKNWKSTQSIASRLKTPAPSAFPSHGRATSVHPATTTATTKSDVPWPTTTSKLQEAAETASSSNVVVSSSTTTPLPPTSNSSTASPPPNASMLLSKASSEHSSVPNSPSSSDAPLVGPNRPMSLSYSVQDNPDLTSR